MKVQRLIEKYELELKDVQLKFGASFKTKVYEELLEDLKQLDEPQKVVVPQFVADWYEKNKDEFELNLWVFLTDFDEENIDMSERFGIWLGDEDNNPIQTLVNMHQFGYEVEEEKRYLVKVKGMNEECEYLVFGELSNTWKFRGLNEFGELKKYHTRKELDDLGFGWVFDCEGIEIEEVE